MTAAPGQSTAAPMSVENYLAKIRNLRYTDSHWRNPSALGRQAGAGMEEPWLFETFLITTMTCDPRRRNFFYFFRS
jgi:hypothetical protein